MSFCNVVWCQSILITERELCSFPVYFHIYCLHFHNFYRRIVKVKTKMSHTCSLRNHAYSNILKISPPKTETFQLKNLIFFSYFCSKHRFCCSLEPLHRGGYNEYLQFMFLSRNMKKNVYPCQP